MTPLARAIPPGRADVWMTLAPSPQRVGERQRRSPTTVILWTLWICVLVGKVALPGNIELVLPILWCAIGYLVVTGRAFVSHLRLAGFALLAAIMVIAQIAVADHRPFSAEAIMVSLALYGIFIFAVPAERAEVLAMIRRFQWLPFFIALMVCIDWAVQFAGHPMPSLEQLIPRSLLYQSYNYVQPVAWGSPFSKPNGLFMLETSHASQLLAMGVAFEICLFRRPWMIALLACTQLATFGGTGLMLLALCVPAMLFYVRGRTLLAVAALATVVAIGASQTPVWNNFASRSNELRPGAGHSSGSGRFIEPYQFMVNTSSRDLQTLLVGIGPGNTKTSNNVSGQMVTTALVKSITEYGLIVGLVWMLFLHGCVIRSRAPGIVIVAVLVQYDFLNGSLIVPIEVAFCYLLAGVFAGSPDRSRDPGR